MRRKYRRASRNTGWFSGKRRIVAVAGTLVVFAGIVTVTQVSNASTTRNQKKALSACDGIHTPPPPKLSTETKKGTWTEKGGVVQHADDGAGETVTATQLRDRCRDWVMHHVGNNSGGSGGGQGRPTKTTATPVADPTESTGGGNESADPSQSAGDGSASADPSQSAGDGSASADPSQSAGDGSASADPTESTGTEDPTPAPSDTSTTPPPGTGLGILTNSCDTSQLPPHDGFQVGNRCVSTEFGEVGVAANNPSLLITQAPRSVKANTAFTLTVSTRNLLRDRFLAAGKGGYYVESSVLTADGIVHGHFHTACRMLANTTEAPDPAPVPAFFVATEDSKGGKTPDSVTISVPGLPTDGIAQCASWAGDGSHRIPMMERANQTPAFDAVRITVRN
jgi:hypothetical protein